MTTVVCVRSLCCRPDNQRYLQQLLIRDEASAMLLDGDGEAVMAGWEVAKAWHVSLHGMPCIPACCCCADFSCVQEPLMRAHEEVLNLACNGLIQLEEMGPALSRVLALAIAAHSWSAGLARHCS